MAIIGINIDRTNPEFTKLDFCFWMPQFTNFFYQNNQETEIGSTYWNKIYPLANKKVFHSIFGSDFEIAISLVIAHYLTLISMQTQAPSGSSLSEIAGGGVIRGILSTATIGDFSKQYDIDKTVSSDDEAKWWNQTSYGAQFWALMKTKSVASIFVVTSNPVEGAG